MTISDIFTLTNGGNGQSSPKSTLGNLNKTSTVDPTDVLFKQRNVTAVEGAAKSAAEIKDRVTVGKLAEALHGRAADFFNQVDEKGRAKLESLVNAGAVSAEDVVKGLQFWADSTSFENAMTQAPVSGDAQAKKQERTQLEQEWQEAADIDAAVYTEIVPVQQEIEKRVNAGLTVPEELTSKLETLQQRSLETSAAAAAAFEKKQAMRSLGRQIFHDRFSAVSTAKAGSGHPDGGAISNAADKAAADRLAQAGITQIDLKSAIASYSASFTR